MSDGITDGYRMSEQKPSDIGRGLNPPPTTFEVGEQGVTGERGSIGCKGETLQSLRENNVDAIAISDQEKVCVSSEPQEERKPTTHFEWVQRTNELAGDSFFDVGSDYKHWSDVQQNAYLEAKVEWHKETTQPLADYLLQHHSEKITGDFNNMYDLSIAIMKGNDKPTQTFLDWDAKYQAGDFVMLSSNQLDLLRKEELRAYLDAERETHQELNRPLYEFVMDNHNERLMQCGTIQAAILDLLKHQ